MGIRQTSAQIFFLKNRGEGVASWSDVQKIENTFSLGDVINSAKERIPSATQTAKRLDEPINKGKGIWLDNKGTEITMVLTLSLLPKQRQNHRAIRCYLFLRTLSLDQIAITPFRARRGSVIYITNELIFF